MLHSILRPFTFFSRVSSRAVPFFLGSLKLAWTPPPWLSAAGRGIGRRTHAAMLLLVAAAIGFGAWRSSQNHTFRLPPSPLVAAATDTTPTSSAAAPISKQPADTRDTSKPRIRTVTGLVHWPLPGWDLRQKKPSEPVLVIDFDAPTAPLSLIGKAAEPGTVKIAPEVPGTWTWRTPQRLAFEPQTGWMPPGSYQFTLGKVGLAPDCAVVLKQNHPSDWHSPKLSASFEESSFYVDPATPAQQQSTTTVTFSQPVSRDEVIRYLTVTNMSTTILFAPGSKPQVIADEKNPMRFFLRSPLIKPGEKEDLVRFQIIAGLTALAGGEASAEEFVTKVTTPSRYTGFIFNAARTQLIKGEEDEQRQFVFLESSRFAHGATVAKATQAWRLPPPPKDKDGKVTRWTTDNVTPEVLAKSVPTPLEYVTDEAAPPTASLFGFRLKPQTPGKLYVRVPKETPAPGGFVLAEDFNAIVEVPAFPREAIVLGQGGILALGGERKLNIKSRGYDHLRFTLARVSASQINHLVSQTNGSFESPGFHGDIGFEDISRFHSTVQTLVKKNDHEANYSAFDFAPALLRIEPGGEDAQRGLFYLSVEGVRRRTPDDAQPGDSDPDAEWIALSETPENEQRSRRRRGDDEEERGNVARDSSDSRFVLITDLGLIVKRNADVTREVFVQSFKERAPVAGVHITVLAKNGSTLAEADTDAQGHATLPALDGLLREKKPVALTARKGADLAFIPWDREDRAVQLSRFDIEGVASSETNALDAFLFTERGIYRPGDSIRLGAIVRQRNWAGALAGLPVEVALFNAKEEAAGVFPTKLNADGFIELTLPTSETAPTGVWRIELRRPDDGKKKKRRDDDEEADTRHLGHTLVRVEEFQPDRLKLAAKLNPVANGGNIAWLAPENISANVDVQTLFGIAAADRRVTAKLHIAPGSPHFDQWPAWSFGLPKHDRMEPREIDLGETETDAEGHAEFELALEAYAAPLLRVSVDLEAFEADGGRGVRGALGTLVSRQPYLIGSKTADDFSFIPRDTPHTFEMVAIGPDAKPVAATGLERVLVETRHISVLTKQDNGKLAYVSNAKTIELETVDGSLPAAVTKITLPVNRAGRFQYEWRDAAGTVLCTVPFTVVGAGEASRNIERSSELEISLPDKAWKSGEQLEVSLRAPYAGAGLITIERDRVIASQWFRADSTSSVQHITIPDGIEGGAYVSVAFVRALDSPEIFTSPLSTGVMPFKVSTERRQLAVTLDAPERAKPGERLRIGFSTPRPARIVVWAVDEGIHRVTSYRAPQPLTQLLKKPSLEVGTWQLLDLLLPEYSLLKNTKAFGGDGDEPPELKLGLNPFKRRRTAPVVYWSGIIESGPEQREVFYDVPDYFAGRLNIMAAAVAPDAVGVAEKHTIVKGPFVLTPNAPFFAAPGDEFNASLTVANQLEGDAVTDQVTVAVETVGGLEIIESPKSPLTIAVGKEVTVRFRVRVKDSLGNAELKFSASAGKERTEQRATMSVRPGVPRAAVVQSGWFRTDTHDVPMKREFFAEFAKREAVVSTTPLGLARGLAAYLREYPHGCSEQITSRAFPWLVLRDDADFGMDRVEAERTVRETISLLARRQRADGGFGYWSSSDNFGGFDYLSVYVTFFLTEAKASGFTVPGPMLDAALRSMRLMADAKIPDPWRDDRGVMHYERTRADANIQAAAIYLITRNEEVTTNYALKMRDFLEAKVPAELWQRDPSAAWLAATWRMLKKEDEAKKLITIHRKARAGAPRNWDWSYYYESDLTREAMTFTVLCRHFPEIAGTFGYDDLRPITEPIEKGDFHTLSAAWSVLALKSYASLAKASGVKAGIAEVVGANAKTLVEPRAGIASARLGNGGAVARFFLTRPDHSPKVGAWYQAIETGFDRALPEVADAHGIEVFREILDEHGDVATMAKTGETLTVRLRVRNLSTTAQPHIALTELLPGAFDFAPQGEKHALKPGLGALPGAEYVDVREDRAMVFCDLAHDETKTFEYSIRPTCAGAFTIPPAYAESMYDRAVNSRGVAGKFTVLPRE